MTNPYIKQFPELMANKTILYVHGFGSSAQSGTVKRIKETFPLTNVLAYDLPVNPHEAMELLHKACKARQPDLIIGSSMGGMYTEMLYGYDRILFNPAFQMGETMREHNLMGKQTFQNPREDGIQEFLVTKSLVNEYKDITTECFSNVTEEERQRVFGLFGDEDQLVHTFDMFHEHYPNAIRFHGDHYMSDKSFLHSVVPVIRWIDDRQGQKDRPVIYIQYETLVDNSGNPKPSMGKAYRFLIESYHVFIVADAPTNSHRQITNVQNWIENHLNVPAYNRIIFTNQKQLLLGDYFIGDAPTDDFMGTNLAFGSEEFKTWEEIITYFSRLNGQ